MRMPGKNWFRTARRKFLRPATKETIVLLHNTATTRSFYSEATTAASRRHGPEFAISKQEFAAIHIQACFRGHLARRAYRALRSLVKLQAIVRGVCVRRQARIALQCMHALARLQVTIRARQLLMH